MAEWDRLDRRTHARSRVPVGRQIEQLTDGRKTVAPLAASHAEAARLLQSIEVAVPQIGVETEVVKRQLFAATDNRVGPHCEQSSFGSIGEIELSPEPIKTLVRTIRRSAAGLAQDRVGGPAAFQKRDFNAAYSSAVANCIHVGHARLEGLRSYRDVPL